MLHSVLSVKLGNFYHILNFVNNWNGEPCEMKTSGTITWSGGGTGGEFFYEQSDTIGSVGGVPIIPDNITLQLNGDVITVKDYVSKSYVDAMLGNVESLLASI